MTSGRVRAATLVWVVYVPIHIGAFIVGLMWADIIPFLMGVPLLVTSIVFALLTWRDRRALAVGTLLASCAQLVIAALFLGGPCCTWHFGTHDIHLPGFVRSIGAPAWVVGVLLPLVIAGVATWRVRRLSS